MDMAGPHGESLIDARQREVNPIQGVNEMPRRVGFMSWNSCENR